MSEHRHTDPSDGKTDVSPSGPGVSAKPPRVNPGNDKGLFTLVQPAESDPVRDTPPPDDLKHPTRGP